MSVILGAAVLIAGLAAGFGINIVATRLAANRQLVGPLRCTRAPHPISLSQAVPLAGYVSQRGRCSTCGSSLSPSYPLVELSTALLFLALFVEWDLSLTFLFHAAYVALLMLVLVIDWKHRDIYVSVIAAGSLVALLGSAVLPDVGVPSALIGAAVAGGFFLLAYLLAKLLFPRIEEPLGAGDVLLALMMGLMLGFPNVVGALIFGALIGGVAALLLLLSRRRQIGEFIPYGVGLCVAAILLLTYPEPLSDLLGLPALETVLPGLFTQP